MKPTSHSSRYYPVLFAALLAFAAIFVPHGEASSAFNPTPTGTGLRHVTAGKEDPAAATFVTDGVGAAFPSTGLIRATDTGARPIIVGLSGGTDYNVVEYNAVGASQTFGNTSQYTYVNAFGLLLTSQSAPATITDGPSAQTHGLLTVQQSLSSNFTTTLNTSTNLNLAFTVTAGEFWEFEFWGTTLNTSGGIKFQISAPATCTVEGWLDSVTTTAILLSRQRFNAINTLNATATNTGVSIEAPTRIFGRLSAVAGGTFSIGVASVTAGQTTTVRAGSSWTARRTTPL